MFGYKLIKDSISNNEVAMIEAVKSENIRRCHVCNNVTIKEDGRVEKCDHCHKNFAPYFFCPEFVADLSATKDVMVSYQKNNETTYPPIYGISLSW